MEIVLTIDYIKFVVLINYVILIETVEITDLMGLAFRCDYA
jgi:hypothetical protein